MDNINYKLDCIYYTCGKFSMYESIPRKFKWEQITPSRPYINEKLEKKLILSLDRIKYKDTEFSYIKGALYLKHKEFSLMSQFKNKYCMGGFQCNYENDSKEYKKLEKYLVGRLRKADRIIKKYND